MLPKRFQNKKANLFSLKITNPMLKVGLVTTSAASEPAKKSVEDVALLSDVANAWSDASRRRRRRGLKVGLSLGKASRVTKVLAMDAEVRTPLEDPNNRGVFEDGTVDVDTSGDSVERSHRMLDEVNIPDDS